MYELNTAFNNIHDVTKQTTVQQSFYRRGGIS